MLTRHRRRAPWRQDRSAPRALAQPHAACRSQAPGPPVDVQSQAVGLPAHRGGVRLQEEATQELDQGLLVRKFVQLVHQSCAQLVLLAA